MEVNMQAEVEAGLFAAAAVEGEVKKKACTNCGAPGHRASYGGAWKCPEKPREDARYVNYQKLLDSWEKQQQNRRETAERTIAEEKRGRGRKATSTQAASG